MTVLVNRKELGECRFEFEFEAPAEEVDAEFLRVVREYRRTARIPGFRKGKAPLDLVRQRFGDAIGEAVTERLAPMYWQRVQEQEAVRPMLSPTLDPVLAAPGEPLRFRMTVDVEPEVDLGDSRSFDLSWDLPEPGAAEVDQLLEQFRMERATWAPVDRAAGRGDRVRGKLHRSAMPGRIVLTDASGQPHEPEPEGELAEATHDIDVEVGGEGLWPELTDNLTGMAAGGRVAFERAEMDQDIERQRQYDVEVDEVLERRLPELTDEWAGGLGGGVESVDELRERLREFARRRMAEQAAEQRIEALLQQLRGRYPVNLPDAAVENAAARMVNSYASELMRNGVDVESGNMQWDRILDDVRPAARDRVHSDLLLDLIARADGIEVGQADMDRALDTIARERQTNRARLRREMEREGALDVVRLRLRRNRTVQVLLETNDPSRQAADGGSVEEGED